MTDREKLIELLNVEIYPHEAKSPAEVVADYLLDNGVTFTPAVPGPSEADPNIMEMCFHNGERHMKEKIGKELARLAEHMPCITLAQAIAMLEDL